MNKQWFEPGPDGKSPFSKMFRKYFDEGMLVSESISAAFRALLAGEDVGRTADAKDAEIARLRAEVERLKSECSEQQRYVLDLESAIARKETRIKVLKVANDSLTQYSSNLTAKRDALQARIDAGVRVWGTDDSSCPVTDWLHIRMDGATRTALIIDAHPIDQPDAAMVDERTGKADRREVGCDASLEARLAIGRDHTRVYVDDLDCNGTVKCARSNDRRRVAGTIADRKEAS